MKNQFSGLDRSTYLSAMENETLDLLVIGGGITGSGIALDAVSRGMETGLIEMQDFAAGTSSRSTKLIHGGLRYLKQFEMKLVAEVGKERAIVYENGPHVTKPIWMVLPIYKEGTFSRFSTSIGLKVYDFLAGVKKSERRQMLSKEQTLQKEPLLRKENLLGSGVYVEYRTDDARLTIEVLKAAVSLGAKAVNYTKAIGFIYKDGHLVGVKATDLITGETRNIYAKKVVNAAGPWVDALREKDHSKKGKYLHLTKGVHLVIDDQKFPLKEAVYFDTPFHDKRMVFAIPRNGKTYVGTTDTNYDENPVHPRMTAEDRDYILAATNFMFPNLNLTANDIESSWSGLRPLIHEEGKDPSEISRKDELFLSESGLITIAGGKLTGYRKMAEKVVDLVNRQLHDEEGLPLKPCQTDRLVLSGGNVGGSDAFPVFVEKKVSEGTNLGLLETEARKLVSRYGSNIDQVYRVIREKAASMKSNLPLGMWAALIYGIEHELVVKPTDFLIRRTDFLYFDIDSVRVWKDDVLQFMKSYFSWTEEMKKTYATELDMYIHDACTPIDVPQDKIQTR